MAVDAQAFSESASGTSAADPTPALPSTEPTGEGAVVESPLASEESQGEPTPEDVSSAEAGPPEDDDEPKPDETSEESKSRTERQFERRLKALLADPEKAKGVLSPILDPLLQAARDKDAAERKAASESAEASRAAQQAELARVKELQEFIGVPDAPDKPGTISTLQAEYETLNQQIRQELLTPTGQVDIDALSKQADEKQFEIKQYSKSLKMAGVIEGLVWQRLGPDFASAATFPELAADPQKQAAYLNAQGGVRGALHVLADTIRAAKDAEKAAELKAQADKHAVELKALQTDLAGWRVRAGGAEGQSVGTGRPGFSGAMTRQQFMALPKDQKDQMRREQPLAVAEIYSRSA